VLPRLHGLILWIPGPVRKVRRQREGGGPPPAGLRAQVFGSTACGAAAGAVALGLSTART
jgi:hypothetical protein